MSRGFTPFSTNRSGEDLSESSSLNDSSWYKDFATNLSREATTPAPSIHDQIHSIINNQGKSKFSSMDEMVNDLHERTGYKKFLEGKTAGQEGGMEVTASAEPDIFKTMPEIKTFVDNYVEDHPDATIDSVIQSMLRITDIARKLPVPGDVSEDVKSYINNVIGERKQDNYSAVDDHNLGKTDPQILSSPVGDGDDPFGFCTPATAMTKLKFIKMSR